MTTATIAEDWRSLTRGESGRIAGWLREPAWRRLGLSLATIVIGCGIYGATIGLWDQQEGVAGRGDYPVRTDTAWSIELNVTVPIPEWDDQQIRIMLEEDAFFDGEEVSWIDGRQEELLLIR